ncbi:MAG: hypothetical protein ACK2T3_12565 [Candidatus Promineifilaceae bacterium]
MEKIRKILHVETLMGEPIQAGEMVITPVSQAVILKIPHFGAVWNRPHQIRITEGESKTSVQIVNITRIAQIAIYGLGAVLLAAMLALSRRRS